MARHDPDRKALARYGVLFPATRAVWLRFLDWCCAEAAARGKRALLLIWDNASWHISKEVRAWVRDHHRLVKASGAGVRLIVCQLPVKSPWLNPIEPKWVHAKRAVAEPDRLLPARELAERACDALDCPYHPHIPIPEQVSDHALGMTRTPVAARGRTRWPRVDRLPSARRS